MTFRLQFFLSPSKFLPLLGMLFLLVPAFSFSQSCCADGTGTITTIAGTGAIGYSGDGGPATSATFGGAIFGLMIDPAGNIYFCDTNNNVIRKISTTGIITTIAGNGTAGFSGDGGPATSAQINQPTYLARDAAGNIYICDYSNDRVRKVDTTGVITTFAGNGATGPSGDGGPATSAAIGQVYGIAVDAAGNVYVSPYMNGDIRKISTTGIITTFVGAGARGFSGDGGPASSAQVQSPEAVAIDSLGNIYFNDDSNYRVRKIDSSGTIMTFAGNGTVGDSGDGGPATSAGIVDTEGIAFCGGNVYLSDWNSYVRMVDTSGVITTIAGNGTAADSGDGGPASSAGVNWAQGLAVDSSGNLYIGERGGNVIRKISSHCVTTPTPTPTPTVCLVAGIPCTPTWTPTATPTFTSTPTPTATWSPTFTSTPTSTPTPTRTYTPCGYPGNTCTPTFTPTLSPTPINVFYVSKNVFNLAKQQSVSIYVSFNQYPGPFDLSIYNSAGEFIKNLDHQYLKGGYYYGYSWDGTNEKNQKCDSGVYIIYAIEPLSRKWARVLLIR